MLRDGQWQNTNLAPGYLCYADMLEDVQQPPLVKDMTIWST